jgi:hypothetical protein
MTYEDQVEVDLHDDINEIVEETLEEASEPKGAGAGKMGQPVGEPESIASVDKASDATKKTSLPKTKAAMVNAMYIKASAMKREELATAYKAMMGENVEVQDELVAGNIDTTAELDALVESEATLSDEFKQKTAVIFEAAVKSKLSEEVSRLEEQYQEELAEEVQAIRSDLVEKIDSYMNYVVESWMEENKLAIQNGLRTEIAEGFMEKMKDLFVESYIDVPESKVDLVDELASQVEELEEKLNAQTGESIKLSEELEQYKRDAIVTEAARGLADTQVEKLRGLVENVDFDDAESFASKVATIKESYFSKQINEDTGVVDEEPEQTVEVSSTMDSYLQAIRNSAKN